ncbi:MAG: restriction endonuclease subunit R [Deltaproteobacteria bacterium RBG_19FT_COMBO_46_12]|nr:MAG: restriction endonuclease subunit R [Deltaproteobacteria bacterium RBG_19FT_COMBO_46_12]
MKDLEDLHAQLQKALAECTSLREENERLKNLLGLPPEQIVSPHELVISEPPSLYAATGPSVTNNSSIEEQVTLFRSLFRGREDIYPIRWEGKYGSSGYSPACANEWKRPLCGKPRTKCGGCENRNLMPVTDEIIWDHLTGKHIIGVYPLLLDETCWFLAIDFDKKTWQEDVITFLKVCREMGMPAALERSRSGHGGHVWIFFDRPIQASMARKFGCAILTRAMEQRHQIGLDSYDRFFPSQDTLPKGGFGNLIALPLQFAPKRKGNSVFMNEGFEAYPDQWLFLSTIKRIQWDEVESIVREASRNGTIINVRISLADGEASEDPWTLPPSKKRIEKPIQGPLPQTVQLVQSNLVYVEKKGLPPAVLNRLIRLAAFQNPDFYRAQAMRFSTFGKPRVIGCAEDFADHIGLPRGCLDEALTLFKALNIKTEIDNKGFDGASIDVTFHGELHPSQQEAGNKMLAYDNGILSAPTAFGKTVVAAWLIAQRKVNTLILVHRRQLMDQWRERLALFFDKSIEDLGQIGGGKTKVTGHIDVGLIQSLIRKGEVKDMVAEYGQVIVDECHHIPAFTFEQVLKQAKARYVAGLTATPIRKDGHHPIIMMQCGPIRFRESAKKQAAASPFEHAVLIRFTDFRLPPELTDPKIQDIYSALVSDRHRNDLIFNDLLKTLEMGRSPLLLTERTEHLEWFAEHLKGFAQNIIILRGGMGVKQRKALAEQIKAVPDSKERVIIATGRYIGEGFDDARLDTLFLAMPISWRGTLQQYVGRLHRLHDNKQVVQVYDYVDIHIPMLMRMYKKRLKGYEAIGYTIQKENRRSNQQPNQYEYVQREEL